MHGLAIVRGLCASYGGAEHLVLRCIQMIQRSSPVGWVERKRLGKKPLNGWIGIVRPSRRPLLLPP